MLVVLLELGTNDDHGIAAREQPPHRFQGVGAEMHPPLLGATKTHVRRHVLSDPQDELPPPGDGNERQGHGMRVGPEDPHHVHVVEHPPHQHQREDQRPRHGQRLGQALIVRKAHQLGVLVQRIVRASRLRVQPTHEDEPLHFAAEHLEKYDKGALPIAPHPIGTVRIVGIDR